MPGNIEAILKKRKRLPKKKTEATLQYPVLSRPKNGHVTYSDRRNRFARAGTLYTVVIDKLPSILCLSICRLDPGVQPRS